MGLSTATRLPRPHLIKTNTPGVWARMQLSSPSTHSSTRTVPLGFSQMTQQDTISLAVALPGGRPSSRQVDLVEGFSPRCIERRLSRNTQCLAKCGRPVALYITD